MYGIRSDDKQSHECKCQNRKKRSKQSDNIKLNTLRNHTTLYHTSQLLNCIRDIQITSNHVNVNVEPKKNNSVNKMMSLNSTHLENILQYIHLPQLYCKGHIQMISNHSNINLKIKKNNNRVNKMTTLNSAHLKNYTTIYHSYQLVHYKGHIQMKSHHNNVNVEIEKTIL